MIEIQNNKLQRVINVLLLHSSFIENLGLFNGKMGISIAFFHLSRQTNNSLYENYAGELIDEIYEEINTTSPWNFEDGLAGIGWGIEYLVQNHFIEADTDEALFEIDNRLTPYVYSFPSKFGINDGLLGVGFYFLSRVKQKVKESPQLITNKQLLIHIIDELDKRTNDISLLIKEPTGNNQDDVSVEDKTLETDINPVFDITWNYPLSIIFLCKVFQLDLCNPLVCKMLERLLSPLNNEANWPTMKSNRLILALALTKMVKEYKMPVFEHLADNWPHDAFYVKFRGSIELVVAGLLNSISPEVIKSEITDDLFMKNGALGITWVYSQLYQFTGDIAYKNEAEYWTKVAYEYLNENDTFFITSDKDKKQPGTGLISGLAAFVIIDSLLTDSKIKV